MKRELESMNEYIVDAKLALGCIIELSVKTDLPNHFKNKLDNMPDTLSRVEELNNRELNYLRQAEKFEYKPMTEQDKQTCKDMVQVLEKMKAQRYEEVNAGVEEKDGWSSLVDDIEEAIEWFKDIECY